MPKKGYKQTEEHKRKLSESSKGKKHSKETKRKMSESKKGRNNPFYGKHHTEELRQKMSKIKIGKYIGENNPMYGKELTEETKQKIRKSLKGKKHSEETKRKMGESRKGKNNPNWNNGSSFEPYSLEFNEKLREQIRERDERLCQFCGEKENGNKQDVHHINYDKIDCMPLNLITVCHSCNTKANKDRDKWQMFFEILQEIKGI